jgi:hypothetical protein
MTWLSSATSHLGILLADFHAPTTIKPIMDHIPKTHNHSYVVKIPIYGSVIAYGEEPLGFQGFRDFPRSLGYNLEESKLCSSERILPCGLLQSWLFFGLLTEIFGGPATQYKHEDFIRTDASGRRMACTKMLDKYALCWMAVRCHEDREAVVRHARDVDNCLRLTNNVLNVVAASLKVTPGEDVWSPAANALVLSLMTLGEYLCIVRESVIKYKEARTLELATLEWHLPLIEKALEQDWCVGEISMLKKWCDLTCLFYLTTIGRKLLGKKHSTCTEQGGCQALQIDFATYKTAHLGDCACNKRVGPSPNEIANIISSGQVPLVASTSLDLSQVTALKVFASRLNGPSPATYVAISHVWSDGLGNNEGNWLTGCMFTHIQNLVNALYTSADFPVPFWMDTLCIPKGSTFDAMKQLALAQMADIYRSADKVLVLDSSLQAVSSDDMSWVEMNMRVGYCPWSTRVWTLQEGRLAREAYFQFKNKAILLADLQQSAELNDNFQLLSNLLEGCDKHHLLECPSSRHLITAVATYQAPKYMIEMSMKSSFENTDEEELHQHAIQTMQRNASLEKLKAIWLPWLREAELDTKETSADEDLRDQIFVYMPGPVACHSMAAINRIRGWGYSHLADARSKNDSTGYVQGYGPCELFLDVCKGFRGRTTSRTEDETICLGLLLQTEMKDLLAIKPMPWRQKDFLVKLDSWKCIRFVLSMFGVDFQKWVRSCHEERTKLLYRQMVKVPTPIIFWNSPRLQFDGWKWAPQSILYKDLEFNVFEPRGCWKRGIVTDRGLTVQLPGFKLSRASHDHEALNVINTCDSDETGSADTTLVIHTLDEASDNINPWRRGWQRLRFRKSIGSDFNNRGLSWAGLVKTGAIENLAILIQEEGVLVKRYRKEDECNFAHHVALIERVTPSSGQGRDQTEVHCFGEYFEIGTWCIG